MNTQPEDLRLADALERGYNPSSQEIKAAAALRRQHALNQELLEALIDLLDLVCELDVLAASNDRRATQARAAIVKLKEKNA